MAPLMALGSGCKRAEPPNSSTAAVTPEAAPKAPAGGTYFANVTKAAGITSTHHKPILDHKLDNIMSWVCSVGAAAAAGDFDNDGWIDLYVTDSRKSEPNYLYRNNHDGTFTDVAKTARVADLNGEKGTSMDAIWGDYDNDGWSDLYVVRWGQDVLFRNKGDGTFEDVTTRSFRQRDGSPGTQWANGNAAIWLDYNLDGRLDLYVGNYFEEVDLWHLESTVIMHDDFEKARNGGRNYLYRQNEDGTFTEQGESLGVEDPGWTLAVGSADLNNDGWPDLYCADDFGPDQLFINTRDRANPGFRNVSLDAIGFDSKKGMNVDFGDFNGDGWIDIYVTNITTAEYLQEGNMLWHNNGPGENGDITFSDVSLETGTYDGGWGWGAKFFDFDNDGDLDIISGNGFISAGEGNYWYDLASWTVTGESAADAANWPAIGDRSFSGYESNRLWRNEGFYTFTERAVELGIGEPMDGRGIVTFDYDNDGDLDLFSANQGQPPALFRNDGADGGHWLIVDLTADTTTGISGDAVGARVTVMTSNGVQIRERDGGNGYSGQSDPRIHFGLGADEQVKLVEVRWPDGGLQYLEEVSADRIVEIRQDPSRYATQLAIEIAPPKRWKRKDESGKPKVPDLSDAEIDRILTEMEDRLAGNPAGYALASTYRKRTALYERHDRGINFLMSQVEQRPDDERVKIELACAYVDKIPTCGGLAAIVSKGTLAKKSLDLLDPVIAGHPNLWVAYYCRGMNHLHWPRALRHSDDAAADFKKCLELQAAGAGAEPRPYYVRTHIAYGDAQAKAGEFDSARRAWRDALALFPESLDLKERLAIKNDGDLLAFVESKRSLEEPIDTSLAFLDRDQHASTD